MEYATILSTALNDKERLLRLLSYPSEIFDGYQYVTIMNELKKLSVTENDIDLPVLVSSLKASGNNAAADFVLKEISTAPHTIGFESLVKRLVQDAVHREISLAQREFQGKQVNQAEYELKYDEIKKRYTISEDIYCDITDYADTDFEEMYPENNFIKWHLIAMNKACIGIFKNNFIVIAGQPGIGKTTFINELARVGSTLYIQLEMTREEIFAKYLQVETEIQVKRIIANYDLTDIEKESLNKAKKTIKNSNIKIRLYDRQNDDFSFIISKLKYELMCNKYDKVIIDNLQKIRNIGEGEAGVANLTGTLKSLCKDFNTPIVALSHMTKASYSGQERPHLGNIKGGGSIAQDCDMLMYIYKISDIIEGEEVEKTIFEIQKDRFAPSGAVPGIIFNEQMGKYVDADYNRFDAYVKPKNIEYTEPE